MRSAWTCAHKRTFSCMLSLFYLGALHVDRQQLLARVHNNECLPIYVCANPHVYYHCIWYGWCTYPPIYVCANPHVCYHCIWYGWCTPYQQCAIYAYTYIHAYHIYVYTYIHTYMHAYHNGNDEILNSILKSRWVHVWVLETVSVCLSVYTRMHVNDVDWQHRCIHTQAQTSASLGFSC
jgi:hypothetical protein